jgi:hypothetical protein
MTTLLEWQRYTQRESARLLRNVEYVTKLDPWAWKVGNKTDHVLQLLKALVKYVKQALLGK